MERIRRPKAETICESACPTKISECQLTMVKVKQSIQASVARLGRANLRTFFHLKVEWIAALLGHGFDHF
jgi:hypothetical protein